MFWFKKGQERITVSEINKSNYYLPWYASISDLISCVALQASSLAKMAETTATPLHPISRHLFTCSFLIPPIATTGIFTDSHISFKVSKLIVELDFVAVSNTAKYFNFRIYRGSGVPDQKKTFIGETEETFKSRGSTIEAEVLEPRKRFQVQSEFSKKSMHSTPGLRTQNTEIIVALIP